MPYEIWKDGKRRWVGRGLDGRLLPAWNLPPPPPPPPFVEEEEEMFFRASVGMNFVVRNQYFGAIIQRWFENRALAKDSLYDMEEELLRMVENHLGWSRYEWWFSYRVGHGVQEVFELQEDYKIIERGLDGETEAET